MSGCRHVFEDGSLCGLPVGTIIHGMSAGVQLGPGSRDVVHVFVPRDDETADEVRALQSRYDRLREIFGGGEPWPLKDVLRRLSEFASFMLHQRNYDGHGHEELSMCVQRAGQILAALDAEVQR